MMNDKQPLYERMDLINPSADDELPMELRAEFGELAERDQAVWMRSRLVDREIRRAFVEGSVPEGLLKRLLAASDESLRTSTSIQGPELVSLVDRPPGRSRRRMIRWLGGVGVAIAAAVLLIATFDLHQVSPRFATEQALAEQALDWTERLSASPSTGSWQPVTASSLGPSPPPGLRAAPRRWEHWVVDENLSVVVYELGGPVLGGRRAFVFAVPAELVKTAARQPSATLLESRGRSAGVWKSGALAFVLVVEGGRDVYARVVAPDLA